MNTVLKIIVVITLCIIVSNYGMLIADEEYHPKSLNRSERETVYTGLLIDARGLSIVAQKKETNLYNEQNEKVCGPFDRKYLFTLLGSNAINDNIIGDNPLRIKAKATLDDDRAGIIVYKKDAKMIKEELLGSDILKKGKVVVLIGEEKPTETAKSVIKPIYMGSSLGSEERNICQEDEDSVVGSGMIIYGDKFRARNEAMHDAYGKVLEKYLDVNLYPRSEMGNYAVFKDIVNGNTHGFVKQWNVISESEMGNLYCVEVEPVIESRAISAKDIEAIRIMIELMNDPRIFISIKEYVNEEELERSIALHTIKSILEGNDSQPLYHLVDSADNADIVVYGESRLISRKPALEDFSGTDFLSCNSEINISIRIGDREKCNLKNTNKNICIPQNVNEVTKLCAGELATKLVTKLLLCMESTIKLVVHNLDASYYTTFPGFMRKMQNVEKVFSRGYKNTTGIYHVHTSGTLNNFIQNLQMLVPDINLMVVSSSQIEIKM